MGGQGAAQGLASALFPIHAWQSKVNKLSKVITDFFDDSLFPIWARFGLIKCKSCSVMMQIAALRQFCYRVCLIRLVSSVFDICLYTSIRQQSRVLN